MISTVQKNEINRVTIQIQFLPRSKHNTLLSVNNYCLFVRIAVIKLMDVLGSKQITSKV